MHAASVNPEPGSNSLKNYILNDPKVTQYLFQSYCLSFFSYFFEFLNVFLTRMHNLVLFQISCCSIFNDQGAALKSASPLYYKGFRLSIPFFNFFQKFSFLNKKPSIIFSWRALFYAHFIIRTLYILLKEEFKAEKSVFWAENILTKYILLCYTLSRKKLYQTKGKYYAAL